MKRKLKIEEHNPTGKFTVPGKPYTGQKASTIRLKGQWLHRLGFSAGASVELTAVSPGVLEIRLCGVAPVSPEFAITAMRLDHAIEADKRRQANS